MTYKPIKDRKEIARLMLTCIDANYVVVEDFQQEFAAEFPDLHKRYTDANRARAEALTSLASADEALASVKLSLLSVAVLIDDEAEGQSP